MSLRYRWLALRYSQTPIKASRAESTALSAITVNSKLSIAPSPSPLMWPSTRDLMMLSGMRNQVAEKIIINISIFIALHTL